MNEDPDTPRRWRALGGSAERGDVAAAVQRGNRRRLLVFGLSFVIALLVGQAWNLSRPSEFRASTRLQVNLPEVGRPGLSASGAYATKLQFFDSRPVLTRLHQALEAAGLPAGALGADPAGRLQSMLLVLPVQGSEIVELRANGSEPRLLADMLNALPEVILQEIAARQTKDADAQLTATQQELARLERTATERRARLDAFRQREGVVAEREDNEAVARTKGLNRALDVAVEKQAAAAARLAAVSQAAEQGRSSTQARVDPALAALETRAHQAREELREIERKFTPAYLAMDPQARALQARLAELDKQIVQQRGVSLQAALQAAEEEHVAARAQVAQLRAELGASRPALTKTSSRIAEAKVLEDDLTQVDKARRDLLERVARLEADEQRRVAAVTVVEAATVPTQPIGPDRWRDGMLVLAIAAALALALTGTVELFNRAEPIAAPTPSTTVLLAPGWGDRQPSLGGPLQPPMPLALADAAQPSSAAALPAPPPLLGQTEAAALLMACRGHARLLCALGLMGLSVDEALQIRPRDLDPGARRLRVSGAWARELPMPDWLPQTLPGDADADRIVLRDAAGQALTAADVESMVISAALDAQLQQAPSLNWEALRNTAIDWLVAQGVRYTDLPGLVGRVDAQRLQWLSSRHGDTRRRELEGVERLMPALQLDPAASAFSAR